MSSKSIRITQEYFDELCIENYEVFEMNDHGEAVQETVAQLQRSCTSSSMSDKCNENNNSHPTSLKHLTLTYPDDLNGLEIRKNIRLFQESLRTLKSCDLRTTEGTISNKEQCCSSRSSTSSTSTILPELNVIYDQLLQQQITTTTANNPPTLDITVICTNLFLMEDGFIVYLTVLQQMMTTTQQQQQQQTQPEEKEEIDYSPSIEIILQTIHHLLVVSKHKSDPDSDDTQPLLLLRQFQTSIKIGIRPLTLLLEEQVVKDVAPSRIVWILVSIIHSSIARCEVNKKLWIECQTNKTSNTFVTILMKALQQTTTTTTADNRTNSVQCMICRIVTTLCTFDDFRTENDNDDTGTQPQLPVVQSGHSAVQALFLAGGVPIVYELVVVRQHCNDNNSTDETIVAAFSALRAMAIQDDVVQCMSKIGVIDLAVQVLCDTVQKKYDDNDRNKGLSCPPLVTAIIGLLRNVSANDDIKTTLCIGKNKAAVLCATQAMDMYRNAALLQEHCCGMFAAMALRKPMNATMLVVDAKVHESIVNIAMLYHPTVVTVQRQAALAIRNIVSRSPELQSMILNDCDTEVTLRTIAAKHLHCQDEVYAALRDLGLPTSSVHVHHDDDGTMTVQNGRSTFGVRNPNFRPDYTTS